jgi:predicted RNase H-like HicB family nuclease
MARRFYPAVLEKGPKGTFALWFPDFPDCVAAGASQEDALTKAEHVLAQVVDRLAEAERPLPEPTRFDAIVIPKASKPIAYFAVGVEPPNPSERVNVYLPRNLIARADARATEWGMSRSSFFGFAINSLIGFSFDATGFGMPRSKVKADEQVRSTRIKKRGR